MAWLVGILKLIVGFVAMAAGSLFVLSCISAITNPQIEVSEKGEYVDKNNNSRIMLALIMSIAWAIIIALP